MTVRDLIPRVAGFLGVVVFVSALYLVVYLVVSLTHDTDPANSFVIPLPPGATAVVRLGDDWCTFRLRLGGKSRMFLLHHGPAGKWPYESLVEIEESAQ